MFCQALFSGGFTMSETWADIALFTLPFRALIAPCFGTVKAPSPVVIITVAGKRSAVSDWHSKWPFCRERRVTWAAQAGTYLKPSPFNEAQHGDSEQILFVSLSLYPLAEPFPGLVGRDHSAGGAGDGAGENLFVKAKDQRSLWASLRFQPLLHVFTLCECQKPMFADGIVLGVLL